MAERVDAKLDGPSAAVMGTYGRLNVVFERGEGSWLIAKNGDRYLDFGSGIAVNTLGHAHPDLIAALTDQAGKLWHTSNLYRIDGQERLAELLCEASFADNVFFCNSGAEACEGAIKLARRYHFANGNPERYRIITFEGCFHGRTLATIAAAGNPKHLEGFGPEAPGFDRVSFADHDATEAAIGEETAAIMIEPVMGEGGIRVIPQDCLRGLRDLCDKHGLLLIMDEVQTGVGRSGKLFAHEWAGITPDVMAIAKGIGGGFPLGAVMATSEAAKGMVPGTHGSTFGGNPLAVAVGLAVLQNVLREGFLEEVQRKASRLRQALAELEDRNKDMIEDVRGLGLLTGIRLKPNAGDIISACMEEKLLTVIAGDNVMRLIPPLNVSNEELSDAVDRISRAFDRVRQKA
ncbi:MAG: aspartate aminotransferase family protein [Hyphomicrobiaceae bacterium]